MLEAAAQEIRARKSVLVVVARGQVTAVSQTLVGLLDDLPNFECVAARFAVVDYEPKTIDWDTWTHRKYGHLYPVLFTDHYVLERVFGRMLHELHRFDPPVTTPNKLPFGAEPRRILP